MENNNEILLALIELAKVQPDLFKKTYVGASIDGKETYVDTNGPIYELARAEVAMYMGINVPLEILKGLKRDE